MLIQLIKTAVNELPEKKERKEKESTLIYIYYECYFQNMKFVEYLLRKLVRNPN